MFEIVSDGTYSFTVNILVENIVDTSGFSYSAYKKYVKDPDCYDRRSEKKKIKNGTKLKLKREFPVSTNTTTIVALLLILHLLLYSTLVLLLLLLLLVLLLYSTLLTTTSSTTTTDCLLYML